MTKYIFDFDDVLFFNTKKFKKHMYDCFAGVGISEDVVKKYYLEERDKGFVVRNLVEAVLQGEKVISIGSRELTERIMVACTEFINHELLDRIKHIGRENCYLVTHGVVEYQLEKIQRTGIEPLFAGISIIQGTKKESIEKICEQYKDDKVVFVDDKEKRFEDLDYVKYPNLRTVLYRGQKSTPEIFSVTT